MRVTDPISGLRASSGDPVIHFTFLISILILNKGNGGCAARNYNLAIWLLLASHAVNFPIILLGCCRQTTKKKTANGEFKIVRASTEIAEKVLLYITMMLYLFSIFFSQDVYFFDVQGECTEEQIGQSREWLLIEIVTFYMGIFSAIAFAISAKVFRKMPDSLMLGESPDSDLVQRQMKKDLFNTSSYSYNLYAGFFVPMGVTLFLAIRDLGHSDDNVGELLEEHTAPYLWLLWLMSVSHFMQVCFISFYIFGFMRMSAKKQRTGAMILIFLALIPFIMFVLQLVMAITTGGAVAQADYLWIISDSIVLALVYVVFLWKRLTSIRIQSIQKDQIQQLDKKWKSIVDTETTLRAEKQVEKEEEGESVPDIYDDDVQLNISDDYYALSFVCFIKYYQFRYNITRNEQSSIMFNVLFVFTMQMVLVWLVAINIVTAYEFTMMTWDVVITRWVCAILLHLELLPELRQSLMMFKYWINHSNNFDLPKPEMSDQHKRQRALQRGDFTDPVTRPNENDNDSDANGKKVTIDSSVTPKTIDAVTKNKKDAEDWQVVPENEKANLGDTSVKPLIPQVDSDNNEPKDIQSLANLLKGAKKKSNADESGERPSSMLQDLYDKLGQDTNNQGLKKQTSMKYNPILLLKFEAQWINEQKDFHLKKSFQFTNRLPPLVICLCQMTAALFTEMINMVVILSSNQAMDVVMNYIALGIIAEIDNRYADCMEMVTFMAIKDTENWQPYKVYNDKQLPMKKRKCWNKCVQAIYKVMAIGYTCVYYYFFPFLIIGFNYFYAGAVNCELESDKNGGEAYC